LGWERGKKVKEERWKAGRSEEEQWWRRDVGK